MTKNSKQQNNNRPNMNSTTSISPSHNFLTSTPSSLPSHQLFSPLNMSISAVASVTTTTNSDSVHVIDIDRETSPLDLSSILEQFETLCISSGNDDKTYQTQRSDIIEPDALVSDSTASTSCMLSNSVRSEEETEDDLFDNIELLIQKFLSHPERQYPYYRLMQWRTDTVPQMEHLVTVITNQPSTVL